MGGRRAGKGIERMGKFLQGLALALLIAVVLIGPEVEGKKKKGGMSKFQKALKCSSCIGAATEMEGQIKEEWKDKGATILVEKRKKKTKQLYVESELAVHEALDKACEDHHYRNYDYKVVEGSPRYTKQERGVDNKEAKKKLGGTCQSIIADHEKEVFDYFMEKKGNSDLLVGTEEEICINIAKMCTAESFATAIKPPPPPPAEEEKKADDEPKLKTESAAADKAEEEKKEL